MFEIKEAAFLNIGLIVLDYLDSLTSYYRRKETHLTLCFITQNNSSLEHWTHSLIIIISFDIMLKKKVSSDRFSLYFINNSTFDPDTWRK